MFQTKTSDRKGYTLRQARRTLTELAKEKGRENAPSYVNAEVHSDRGNTPAPAQLGLQNTSGGQKVLEMYLICIANTFFTYVSYRYLDTFDENVS